MKGRMASQAGFSLVEIMIVLAIIGILATMAFPSYQGLQRRARQAEAKNLLSAIYTGEKAYLAQFNGYTDNLVKIGFTHDGGLRYNAGFSSDGTSVPDGDTSPASLVGANDSNEVCVDATFGENCEGQATVIAVPGVVNTGGGSTPGNATTILPNQITFIAAAIGDLGGALNDVWGIDEQKRLVNPQSGL